MLRSLDLRVDVVVAEIPVLVRADDLTAARAENLLATLERFELETERSRPGRPKLDQVKYIRVSHLPDVCLVVVTPDSSEIRWVPTVPEPGVRLPGRFPGESLVIDEVLRSGVMTYTVFGSTPPEGRMDHAIDQALDLAAGAIDRVQESVAPTLRPSRLSS